MSKPDVVMELLLCGGLVLLPGLLAFRLMRQLRVAASPAPEVAFEQA